MGRAGLAFITGSATNPTLTDGKNPTFFRVVSNDDVQGPQDANYIVNHLHPKALMIVDDQEAYSTGLVSSMTPVFKAAGITVDHESVSQKTTDFSSLVSKVNAKHVGRRPAVAGRRERAAVRAEPRRAAEEGGDLRNRRAALIVVHDPRLVRLVVRARHQGDSGGRLDRGRGGQDVPSTARSDRPCTRPRT